MQKNIGRTDRLIRGILALFLFVIGIWAESPIALALACFTLFEAAVGWCVLYQILGKNSCPRK